MKSFGKYFHFVIMHPKDAYHMLIQRISGFSYYPEIKRKNVILILFDQIRNLIKYGKPERYYFLYGLDTKYGHEYDSYVSYPIFMKRRDFLNYKRSPEYNNCCILRNKLLFGIYSKSIGILTPPNRYYYQNGVLYEIKDTKEGFLSEISFQQLCTSNHHLFVKSIKGECGYEVFKLDICNEKILLNNAYSSISELKNIFGDNDFIFQECVVQNHLMASLNPSSLNTLRLITVRDLKTGTVKVWPSELRIGVKGNFVDNATQGAIIVGVNLNNGKLKQYGFQRPEFGGRSEKHPDSGIKYSDFTIPYFKEAVQEAILFHSMLKDIHSIGWDIAFTENGPIFIEGNDNWEITGIQATNGGMKELFQEDFF